jgi:hypothetical protein
MLGSDSNKSNYVHENVKSKLTSEIIFGSEYHIFIRHIWKLNKVK